MLKLNGLNDLEKIEELIAFAERLDDISDMVFLVYAVQHATELMSNIRVDERIDNSKKENLESQIAYQWGRIYFYTENWEESEFYLEESMRFSTQEFFIRRSILRLISVYIEQERFDRALTASYRLLERDISNLQRYNVLLKQAYIHRMLMDAPRAKESASRALRLATESLDANGFDAMLELGHIEVLAGNPSQAKSWWEEAYREAIIRSSNQIAAQTMYNLAVLSQSLGYRNDAYEYAQRALLHIAGEQRDSLFSDIHFFLADYYLEQGIYHEAFAFLKLAQQAQQRVLESRRQIDQWTMNINSLQDSNEVALMKAVRKWQIQRIISMIQLVFIFILVFLLFFFFRKNWEAQSQQRIATLAYKSLTKRISQSRGSLQTQIAEMLSGNYSFGIIVLSIKNIATIKKKEDSAFILELALEGLKNSILQQYNQLSETHLSLEYQLVFLYFNEHNMKEFETIQELLPKHFQFLWQNKPITLDIGYHAYHYNHEGGSGARELLAQWIGEVTND
ncbi:hypothetical protein PVA44_06370 [Entomospira nematocerorum]|uniref:MalT-like TPR region domain-containing protein n=1 Tax=Entomospira nematocerorum TaxID=2719987 RepID=A0A968KTM9_9SPIO|nr:hypothetical protein [Entomospira nematocera]NIZ46354.1 hypothetical protein [Entomospira nematocera]WDI33841.1 hypothetical protein PVA44_06370 [Entomospira nematocera]